MRKYLLPIEFASGNFVLVRERVRGAPDARGSCHLKHIVSVVLLA